LDKALERLRDLHLNYKDLSQRCMVEIGAHSKFLSSFLIFNRQKRQEGVLL